MLLFFYKSIDYLLFYVPLKNISLIWRSHHNRWRAAKFRLMLGAHPRDRPFQSPLTTHKGMQRIYSNPDPHGSSISGPLRHTMWCGGPIVTRWLYKLASIKLVLLYSMYLLLLSGELKLVLYKIYIINPGSNRGIVPLGLYSPVAIRFITSRKIRIAVKFRNLPQA
jgi:hypothetical protein